MNFERPLKNAQWFGRLGRRGVVVTVALAMLVAVVPVVDDPVAVAVPPAGAGKKEVKPLKGEHRAFGNSTPPKAPVGKAFRPPVFDSSVPSPVLLDEVIEVVGDEPVVDEPAPPVVSPEPTAAPPTEAAPVVVDEPAPATELAGFDAGSSVEVAGERDAFRTVWANADGTSTVELSSVPVHFEDATGLWQPIDNVVAPGADGVLTNGANSWSVRFEPMAPGGGVRIDTAEGPLTFWAENAVAVAPVVEPDGVSVRYVDVVPGSDLVYRVTGAGVEELLVVKTKTSTPQVSFLVDGAEFDSGKFGLEARGRSIRISNPESFTGKGRQVEFDKQVFTHENRPGNRVGRTRITLGLNASWVAGRQVDEFPLIVDPSVIVTTGASWAHSFANYTNTGGSYASYNDGYVRVGNSYLSSTSTVRWRSTLYFPYESYLGANVSAASMTATYVEGSGSGTRNFNVYWASQDGFHYGTSPYAFQSNALTSPVVSGWTTYATGAMASTNVTVSGNLNGLYNNMTRRSTPGAVLLVTGDEAAAYTFKRFTATLSLTLNRWPNTFTGSTSGAYLVPTITRPTVTDPDADTLSFRYSLYNSTTATGTPWARSAWTTASSFTAPKVPATWNGQTKAVTIEASDGFTDPINGETHVRVWTGSWTANDRAPNAAALSSPLNAANVHDLTPTFTSAVATDPDGDAVQYRFFTCTASTCATRVYQPTTAWQTGATWSATPTTNIGAYGNTRWWGVESYDGALTTTSAIRSLNLTNTAPNAATALSPATGANSYDLTPTLTATAATDADGDVVQYRFFTCTASTCATRSYVPTTAYRSGGTTWTATPTADIGVYGNTRWWGVETYDGTVTTTSAINSMNLVNNPPNAAALTAPVNASSSHNLTQTFTANTATDPDGNGVEYRFFYCTGTCTTRSYMTAWVATAPWSKTFTFDAALYNTPLSWGVETRDVPWNAVTTSALRTLTLTNAAPVITNVAPADNTIVAGLAPTFGGSVTDPDGDPINYRYVITPASGIGIVAASPWTNLAAPGALPTWTLPNDLISDIDYRWRIETKDSFQQAASSPNRTISAQGRLGAGSVSPTQQVGPVTVNLATGNVFFTAGLGRTIGSVGGPISAGLTYNSNDRSNVGLTGTYYTDTNANGAPEPSEVVLERIDRLPTFNWGANTPAESVPPTGFKVRWTGNIRIPNVAGDWTFAGGHDGPITIKINGATGYTNTSSVANDDLNGFAGAVPIAGLAGKVVPIQIDYTHTTGNAYVGLRARNGTQEYQIEQSWLAQTQPILPTGWNLTVDTGLAAEWTRADIHTTDITLVAVDGEETVFERDLATGAYLAPPEVDDIMAMNAGGSITVQSADGNTYLFDNTGTLVEITSTADNLKPAGARAVYATSQPNPALPYLIRLEDKVDPTRTIVFHYNRSGDSCPQPEANLNLELAPAGMLCEIDYPDGSHARLFYQAGQLARISNPGDDNANPTVEGRATTDLRWTLGRLTSVTEVKNNDRLKAETANYIPAPAKIGADALDTEIVWDASTNRPTTIVAPAATAGAARQTTGFGWNSASRTTTITQTGVSGTARTSTHDATGRSLADTDAVGRTTTNVWAPNDDFVLATTAGGRVSTTIYDSDWHATNTYGPALVSACFNTTVSTPTGTCIASTPRTQTDYDHNLTGLTGTAWNNTTRTGSPAGTSAAPAGALSYTWPGAAAPSGITTTNGDNWSARFTGVINLTTTTTYSINVTKGATDTATVYIDNQPVTGPITIAANNPTPIRIDFTAGTGNSSLNVTWTPSGGTAATIPANVLKPGFWYPTRTTITDSGNGAPTSIKETRYDAAGVDASLGLVTAEIDDPNGLALTTTFGYEPATVGSLLRKIRSTLPAFAASPTTANSTTYEYWAPTASVDNPCTTANDPARQAGLLRYTQDPTPAVGSPIRTETIYDTIGRPVATRYTNESTWTCVTYDARGRSTSTSHPADAVYPTGRTVVTTFAVGGDPYTTSISDPAGAISTTNDALGRTVSTTDVWNKTTSTSYDTAGRAASTTSAGGVITNTYDNASRLITQKLGGNTLATLVYSPDTSSIDPGKLTAISYPSGAGNAGNGTRGDFTYDALGNLGSIVWKRTSDNSTITADAVTRSLTGRILTNTVDNNPTPAWTYTYDSASRLTSAVGSGHNYTYNYAPSGGCGANPTAGANTNRTSMGDNGTITAMSCYDNADRLTSTTEAGYTGTIVYDAHGNTINLGGDTYTYDAANRHVATENPGVRRVSYLRDALSRIVQRTDTDLSTGVPVTLRYSYGDSGDAADLTLNATATAVVETNWTFPGGVTFTQRPTNSVWSYPNIHGDNVASADSTGAKQGPTRLYDPFGNPLNGIVDNQTGDFDNAWVGQHQRPYEHAPGIKPTIEMGARPYNPTLGRFLSVDPVPGGSANDYDYTNADPINQYDLNGEWPSCKWCRKAKNGVVKAAKTTWKYRNEIALGLGVVGMFACTVCGMAFVASMAVGGASTANDCIRRQWGSCGLGAASLGLGGLGQRWSSAGKSLVTSGRAATQARGISNVGVRFGGRVSRVVGRTQWLGGKYLGWSGIGLSGCNMSARCRGRHG